MIRWSPIKLKFTLGIGSLGSIALLSELSQKAIPAWLSVGVVILPFAVFVFADPDDLPHSVARFLQVGASLWYLAVNSVLVVLFASGGVKVGWWLMFIFLAVGAIPCLIVLGRAIIPEPPEEENHLLNSERDDGLPWEMTPRAIGFSEAVVYRPRKGKLLLFLLLSLAFVAGGLLMIHDGRTFGWVSVAFFGLCAVVFALQLLLDRSYLRISPNGIEIRSLRRTSRYEWSDISHFYAGDIGPTKMVLFDFSLSYKRAKISRALSKTLAGAEGCLPDTYGFTAEALAEHLSQWMLAQMVRAAEKGTQ